MSEQGCGSPSFWPSIRLLTQGVTAPKAIPYQRLTDYSRDSTFKAWGQGPGIAGLGLRHRAENQDAGEGSDSAVRPPSLSPHWLSVTSRQAWTPHQPYRRLEKSSLEH